MSAKQRKKTAAKVEVDPTTYSVVWNRFDYVTEQIGAKVLHATQSFVTANVRDLGQSIQDASGRIVCTSAYLPVHTLIAEVANKGLNEEFGGHYEPGDFIIANDPYIVRGGHLPDWSHIKPIFYDKELVGFLQCKTHVADTGGFLPGGYGPGAYDVVAEGLNIPPLKLIKGGELQEDVWRFLLKNVRNSKQVEMDTMLIHGALKQGEEQVLALIDKYGLEQVKACMNQIVESGESSMRTEISKLPDGVYTGESAVDWDGMTDEPVWVRVKATIEGDEITFDFSDSDPQATFVNSPLGNTLCFTMIAMNCIVDPNIPKNSGNMIPVHLITPEGSVVNPIYPATVGASPISVGTQIAESVLMALGKAVPDQAMAAWSRHCCPINIGVDPRVIDPRTGQIKQYFGEHFASDAGSGAVKGYDGWQGILFMAGAGNFMRPNIEMYECDLPFRVLDYQVAQDWEGAGEFRGAPGTRVMFTADTAEGAPSFLMTGNSDGQKFAPFGVAGGESPPLVEMYIDNPQSGERRILRTMANQPVYPHETIELKVSGGGGWGNPLKRDVDRVLDDVVDEYVSLKRAKETYGVVIDPKTMKVDRAATREQRKKLARKPKAH